MTDLLFNSLTHINKDRLKHWHGPGTIPWMGSDWSNAMQGEAGEAGNIVKKLRRIETKTYGKADPPVGELIEKLGEELADTIIYVDLVAQYYGISLPDAIISKFNKVSIREDLPHRLHGYIRHGGI